MIHLALMVKVLETYPERPTLDPAEWPYTREELEDLITKYMGLIAEVCEEEAEL